MKLIFCLQINAKIFYKLIVSRWVCIARHAQSTQNTKFNNIFVISKEVDFLPTDKCKSFLQVDSITLGLHSQACPKYPKHYVYNIFVISKENLKEEHDFLPTGKHKGFFKLLLSF